jgi:TolB protein
MTLLWPMLRPTAPRGFALVCWLVTLAAMAATTGAAADTPAQDAATQPDESVLGTVDANGSGEGLPPLPKMGVVPVVPTGTADSLVYLVVRHDMELSGQFDVQSEDLAPPGPFTHTTGLDLSQWRAKGAEYVLRVYSQPAATDSSKTELVGEAFVTPNGPAPKPSSDSAYSPPDPKPAFRTVVPTATTEVRAASHRLVDQLLGALTGRPGGFASEMAYAERVGHWRQIFAIDSDGFDLRAVGPTNATALSPAFGPAGQIYYALSDDYTPFRLVQGPEATPVPTSVPGSIMGLAIAPDRTRMALTVMDSGTSSVWVGSRDALKRIATEPFANHPAFGPLNKLAYIAGSPVQRVYVDGKPISPPGFMASAPVFCDTPQGLLVVFTVGIGSGADIIAMDSHGGSVRRLTQHEGANTYAACSPDGRLVAFFSTGKRKLGTASGTSDAGAGLFIMPIQRPWLAKKISSEVGESLRWEPITPPATAR